MARKRSQGLTDREAEIMSILWDLGCATVDQVRARMKGDPTGNTVRTLMGIMVERGLIEDDGRAYAREYTPRVERNEAQASAARRLIDSLFAGSAEDLVMRLMDEGEVDLDQLNRLQRTRGKRRK